jgi:hypothetical protein
MSEALYWNTPTTTGEVVVSHRCRSTRICRSRRCEYVRSGTLLDVFKSLNLRAEAAGGADEEAAAFADEEASGFVEEGALTVAAKVLAQGLSWIYLRL